MLPSLGRSAADFARLGNDLANAGFQAVAINPRGIAGSTGRLDEITLHDLARDIAEVIDALDLKPAHVLGHAFGNRIARCVAADFPASVRTVTLLAAGGRIKPDKTIAERFRDALLGDPTAPEFIAALQAYLFSPHTDARIWRDGWAPATAAAQLKAAQATDPAAWWRAGRAPLLVIQGLDDVAAPPANGRLLQQELGGRVTLIEIERAGHALLPEQPMRIANAVVAFLKADGVIPDCKNPTA